MRVVSAQAALAGAGIQLLVALAPVCAQTNVETNAPGVQLNFSTPGARSLAQGGTFLGRADDATAAYANPAGLANLPQREASLELRAWGYTHIFTDRGRAAGDPSGLGVDDVAGLVDGEATDNVAGLSFASVVFPRNRWAFAFYLHTLADFEANFSTQGAFFDEGFARLRPVESRSRLEIQNLGVSASYRLTQDLSLGLGLSRYQFEIESTLSRFDIPFPPFAEEPGELDNVQTQNGSDSDLGMTVGLLWRLGRRWQVGGVYRQGPSFRFEARNDRLGDGLEALGRPATFNVPDQWGFGVMLQATDRLIVGFDYYRIEYSAFAEDFTVLVDSALVRPENFSADDANEFHAGLEYAFPNGTKPWFVRSGVWYDPAHGVEYSGDSKEFEAIFRSRKGSLHWAAGSGVVGNSYQLDFGVDYSERTVTFSISTVVRF